mgnify:CR=1 FL=1
MNIVYIDYEESIENEDKTSSILSTRVEFDRKVSTKKELLELLYIWKPLRVKIITVKNESGEVILTKESWDDFFKGEEYTL